MNPQTTLALVRHGETEWNAQKRLQGSSDIPLNDTGRGQVRATAELLRDEPWDLIVSSPLIRARQSADIIGEVLGLEVVAELPELVERDYGSAEGLQDGELLRSLRIPGGFTDSETEDAVAARASIALDHAVTTYAGSRIIVVAHGTLIRLALGRLSGHAIPTISNAGHSVLHHDAAPEADPRWRVSVVNSEAFEPADASA